MTTRLEPVDLAIIAKGAGLVGFDPVSTTRSHSPAKMMGDVTRADFGPDGPEGDAYFEAYVEAHAKGEGRE